MRSPGSATTFSGSKCRPPLAVVEPAKTRWTTPVGRTGCAGTATVRPTRAVAVKARDVKATMLSVEFIC